MMSCMMFLMQLMVVLVCLRLEADVPILQELDNL